MLNQAPILVAHIGNRDAPRSYPRTRFNASGQLSWCGGCRPESCRSGDRLSTGSKRPKRSVATCVTVRDIILHLCTRTTVRCHGQLILKLYKYGSISDYSETLFSSPQVFFEEPERFNDPFECTPIFTFDGTEDEFIDFMSKMLLRLNAGMTEQTARATAASYYIEGRHTRSHTVELFQTELHRMLRSLIAMYCLSERNDSVLMWAHYATKHTGFCIEFEASDETPFFGTAQPVTYESDYPHVDFFKTPKDEQLDPIFLTKSCDWGYEREWRIIDHTRGRGLRRYPESSMTGVIFGARISEMDKRSIIAWLEARKSSPKLYQATRHTSEFKIEVHPSDI